MLWLISQTEFWKFLDLSKALDTVDHSLLLTKLKQIGASDNVTGWFRSYLSNRFQLTAVGDVQSTLRPIQVGVPQGSILGPLLFLVYINDLPECLEHCEVALYADDTVIYFSSSCVTEIEIFINRDLSKLSSWFSTNRLTLNVSKSKFILIGSPKKLSTCNDVNVVIDDSPLECTDTFKYLGVTINKTMTWGDHVEAISTKINQRLGLLKRISYLLPLETRITLYNSLVRPLFDYGDTIWGDKGNATLMNELQLLQNKAAKIILSLPSFYSSTEALKELCWPTLFKLRLFHRCVFVYKHVNGIIDFKFDTKLISDIHSYNTRGKSNFYLPRVRRNYGKQRLLYQGLGEWNSLDKSIRDMKSLLIFKQALKTAIF